MSLGEDMDIERGTPKSRYNGLTSIYLLTYKSWSSIIITCKKKGGLPSKKRRHNDTFMENFVIELGRTSSIYEGSREDFKASQTFLKRRGKVIKGKGF